jgi:hypothetical protein
MSEEQNVNNNQNIEENNVEDRRRKKTYSAEEIEIIKSLFHSQRRQEKPAAANKHLKKTKYCKSVSEGRECSYGSRCFFAHSEHELVLPRCSYGIDCKKKNSCQFTHSVETEEAVSPKFQQFLADFISYYNKSMNFKTKMCRFIDTEQGCQNANCTFAHSESELNKPVSVFSEEPLVPSQVLRN